MAFSEHLRTEEYDLALSELRSEPKRSTSTLRQIGMLLLLKGDVDGAHLQFAELTANQWKNVAGAHCDLGLASWIGGHSARAVSEWKRALDCNITDTAGGIETPLLLLYAAVTSSELSVAECERILAKSLESPWALSWKWLTALGRFMLDRDCLELDQWTVGEHEFTVARRRSQFNFYSGVKARRADDAAKFGAYMRSATDVDVSNVWGLLEWHLARYEVSNLAQ